MYLNTQYSEFLHGTVLRAGDMLILFQKQEQNLDISLLYNTRAGNGDVNVGCVSFLLPVAVV